MFGWLRNLLQRSLSDNKGPFYITDPRSWDTFFVGQSTDAGEQVTAEKMVGVAAVWQAVGMIAGDVSKLPLGVFRRRGKDREEDRDHPASWIIRPDCWAGPEHELSSLTVWRRLMIHALIWPRGYVLIDRDERGTPIGLSNLLPDRTELKTTESGRLVVVSQIDSRYYAFAPTDVIMVENIAFDSGECDSFGPLKAAKENIGMQLAKRKFGGKFYSQGCHAGGWLEVPPGVSDKARQKMEEGLKKKSEPENWFRAMVLRDGFKWHSTMVAPAEAQSSELDEAEVRNVARFYRMSPSRLGVKESISYNSEEAARRAYHDETLSFWLKQIATECTLKLLTDIQYEHDTHFIEHNIHALNWADTPTLISVGVQGITNGVWSPDEVRRWFNYPAWPGNIGDKPFQPLNMQLLGEEPEPPPEPPPEPAPVPDPAADDDEEEEPEDEGDTDGDGTEND